MFTFAPYDALKPGQLWLAPHGIGGLLRADLDPHAQAILEVAAAGQGLSLHAMIERDFDRLQGQWLAGYRFDAPDGTWRGRFDHRRWGKKGGILHCHFTDVETGKRHLLSVFRGNHFRPRHAGPSFRLEALTGQVFRLTTARSKSGYPDLIHAELDTRQAAGSWAMAPEAPSASPHGAQAPQKTAILKAFRATGPVCRPRPPR